MKKIELDTTISDLLNDYEGMKEILISINPKFKKLNNPILRRTLAKIATVKQAAIIGGMEPIELLNKLRVAVGQEIEGSVESIEKIVEEKEPNWINLPVDKELNANEILDANKNPLAEVRKALKELNSNILKINSDFCPEPLIDELRKNGYNIYCKEQKSGNFVTYVKK